MAPPGGPAEGPGVAHDQRQRRLLLVVDQFEELFTLCANETQRRAFITALHAAAATAHRPGQAPAALVVLGVRADFEARCADYPQLAGAVQNRYLVTAMTERQLRMAITEPAKKAGSKVNDDLVEVLLAEVGSGQRGATGAGVLPLLSHALDQAWRCRTGEAVTLADYERAGGIEGAVDASAQRAYERLTPAQQAVARQVFLRLTATSSDGVDTAGRATRVELTDGRSAAEAQDVGAVLESFAAERLLTLAARTVEISHEVLLTAWPLLRDTWLAETRADRVVRTRLHATAGEWAHHARDPSYLYSGSLLQTATETTARIGAAAARHPPLSQTDRDFLHASNRAHRRRSRRRQASLAFLIALVIGLASVAVLAIRASRQAASQRDIRDVAISELLLSESQSHSHSNPTLAKLLSIAAWRVHRSAEARYAMLAPAALPGNAAVLTGHAGPVFSLVFSPNGKTLATGNADGTVRLWNVATHQQITVLRGHAGPIYSVGFTRDGKTLASDSADGIVQWWNLAKHPPMQLRRPLTGYTVRLTSMAVSPDGKTRASGGPDGMVRLWDVATHQQITVLRGHAGPIYSVGFSPDGKTLASGADGTVRLWNVAYLVDVVARLCALVGRSITRAEWARYIPFTAYQKLCP